jgi:hypothetical protein
MIQVPNGRRPSSIVSCAQLRLFYTKAHRRIFNKSRRGISSRLQPQVGRISVFDYSTQSIALIHTIYGGAARQLSNVPSALIPYPLP